MYKIELHAHTAECDKVVQTGAAEIVKMYCNAGYSGIVITDHYNSVFFDWFKDELCMSDHRKIVERYLKGYYAALNEGEKSGITVLCGAEVRFSDTLNDYLVYGLEEKDFYELPLLNRLKNLEELINVLPNDAVVVQAHPFRNNMTICDPTPIFGIEVHNGSTERFRNEMAKMYAAHYKKVMTSGSDFHRPACLAKGGIETNKKIYTSKDLTDVLRSGNYTLIENY